MGIGHDSRDVRRRRRGKRVGVQRRAVDVRDGFQERALTVGEAIVGDRDRAERAEDDGQLWLGEDLEVHTRVNCRARASDDRPDWSLVPRSAVHAGDS
jgi:hypothetical protein